MRRIIRDQQFIGLGMSCFPVQRNGGYFRRFAQIYINPFIITRLTRPATAVTGINSGPGLTGIFRDGRSKRFFTKSKIVRSKIQGNNKNPYWQLHSM